MLKCNDIRTDGRCVFVVLSAQKVPLSLRQKPTECKNNFSTQSLLKAAR